MGREGILGDAHYIMGHIDAFQVQSLESEMVGENSAEVVLAVPRDHFEACLAAVKTERGVRLDTELDGSDWKRVRLNS